VGGGWGAGVREEEKEIMGRKKLKI